MYRQSLDHCWKMRRCAGGDWLNTQVPATVYGTLLQHGRMPDPYYRDNELEALSRMDEDYEFETVFDCAPEMMLCQKNILCFEGLDTLAGVFLNGVPVLCADNMHRTWQVPVTGMLKSVENRLKIVFKSPTRYIRAAYEACPTEGTGDAMRGFPLLRKAHCMFGWDWGPRLPDMGIWRSVSLWGVDGGRIDSVYITQRHEDGCVFLDFDPTLEDLSVRAHLSITVTAPDGRQFFSGGETLKIDNPQLWWPNGLGEQPLYCVCVQLCEGDAVLDTWSRRIGLRTLTVDTSADAYGSRFAHVVNGVPFFAMGADYIPEDCLMDRLTPQRTRALLQHCRDAHFNCIRVWGGGHYPADAFYDVCDELGLVVWQDFMFACAVYDLNEAFEENITAEFKDNIKRLRHHAALGLWCGNNEMEDFVRQGVWVTKPRQRADYIKMYEYILPRVLRQYDPQTFYWPASPSSGGSFDDPNGENRGDTHYWQVWHGGLPFTDYRRHYFRYLSEFGFQSFPSLETVKTFTQEEDRNIFSYVMEKHQRNNAANGAIMRYMAATYLYPTNFDTLLYASQLLQADAIRYGVEHFRRNRGRCMGTVYWQLNDCWPVASWSSIDYFGRWKALHYAAKRFFAPLLLSCQEEGFLTDDPNINAQPHPVPKSFRLCLSNESREAADALVCWQLRDAFGTVLESGEETVHAPAQSAVWLDSRDMGHVEWFDQYVSFQAIVAGQEVSGGTALFSVPKYFHFADPKLSLQVTGDVLTVCAQAYAKSVQIQNASDDLILSDNFFDMNAGTRRVRILSGDPVGLTARSVYDIR